MNLQHHSRVCLCCYDGSVNSQNLLLSLNMLQDKHGDQAVPFNALVQHMKFSYKLIGDVESQVQCALNAACDLNYVAKMKKGYKLLPPEASLHATFNTSVTQAPCPKKREKSPSGDDDSSSGNEDDDSDDDCSAKPRARKKPKRDCDGFLSRFWPQSKMIRKPQNELNDDDDDEDVNEIRHYCAKGSNSTEELKADILGCW